MLVLALVATADSDLVQTRMRDDKFAAGWKVGADDRQSAG